MTTLTTKDGAEAPRGAPLLSSGSWFAPARGTTLDFGAVIDAVADKAAVLLGETHDRPEVHRWQLHVAAALHARGRPIALGFEMFPRRLQPALHRWVAGATDTEEFLLDCEWFDVWGFDPELYLPLFHFCRQQRVPMLALNCYRALVSRVRQVGWAAIPEAERDGLTPPAPATDAYRRYLLGIMNGIAGRTAPRWRDAAFDGFVAAQQTWDRAFAVNIARARAAADPPLVIGIIGRGHLEFGHGTPYQLRDLGIADPAVLLTTAPGDDPSRALAPGIADAVFALDRPDPAPPRPMRLGLAFAGGDGLVVESVSADGPAAAAGLTHGDRVCGVAGREIATRRDLSALLRRLTPGLHLPVVIARGDRSLSLTLHLPAESPPRLVGAAPRPPWPG